MLTSAGLLQGLGTHAVHALTNIRGLLLDVNKHLWQCKRSKNMQKLVRECACCEKVSQWTISEFAVGVEICLCSAAALVIACGNERLVELSTFQPLQHSVLLRLLPYAAHQNIGLGMRMCSRMREL